jgi:hypothetical protein
MPTALIASCVSTNDCVHCKTTDCCCSQSHRESVIFPSNEYNDGHPCLRQWLLVVLVPMSFLQEIVQLYLWRWFMRASSYSRDYCLVLTAGSAFSSQSCLYWARSLLNSFLDTLYCMRVSTWGNRFGRIDNLPSLGWIFLLETVQNLQTGAQPYQYLPCMKWRPHQHPPNPFTWYLVWCW